MQAKIISTTQNSVILQVEIPLSNNMLEGENHIQNALNDVGVLATGELLKQLDSDGSPIMFGSIKMTSKGKIMKQYQTPYGVVEILRHVYQSAEGGATFCPLDENARIIVSSTPRFAKQISHKFAEGASTQVKKDLEENHNRTVARSFLQNVADAVGAVALLKEEAWEYTPKVEDSEVKTIAISLDGTCMLLCEDGYRQAMVGTLSFYDRGGDRLHTTYIASAPEYGKETFKEHLTREIERTKARFSHAHYLGVADGAKENWDYLKPYTDEQVLDFWHASEYLTKVADAIYPKNKNMRSEWLEDRCHRLKHNHGAASRILTEMKEFKKLKLTSLDRENLNGAISYFENNHKERRMNYAAHIEQNHCIGSGVTEAACKVIVKQRLCKSGMKWKERGAGIILSLRSLVYSGDHWDQFWEKISQFGLPIAA
jgi:hypothetical protein